jgi:hypothetical protein
MQAFYMQELLKDGAVEIDEFYNQLEKLNGDVSRVLNKFLDNTGNRTFKARATPKWRPARMRKREMDNLQVQSDSGEVFSLTRAELAHTIAFLRWSLENHKLGLSEEGYREVVEFIVELDALRAVPDAPQ